MTQADFRTISPEELALNPFKAIGKGWMLITPAAKPVNPMTASWGGMGILWGKPVALVVIRPQRFTYGLMGQTEDFSLTFFDEAYRAQLNLCGTKSGRDVDKVAACGFSTLYLGGVPYYAQAHTALFCKKLYRAPLEEGGFLTPAIPQSVYSTGDYHTLFVGEVKHVLVK